MRFFPYLITKTVPRLIRIVNPVWYSSYCNRCLLFSDLGRGYCSDLCRAFTSVQDKKKTIRWKPPMNVCCQWKFAKSEPFSRRRINKESLSKTGTKLVSTPFIQFACVLGGWNSKSVHICIQISITPHKVTQFNNFQILSTNLLLTERKGHNNEYWPEVVPVRTEHCEVRTKTTEGQYSPVQIKLARLIRSLFHGTPWRETVCSEKSQPRRPESIRTLTFTSRLSCHKHTCNIHHYIVQYTYLLLFLFCRCWRHTKRSMNITGWNWNTDRVYTRRWRVKWHSQGTTGR